jgi:carboxyl-terminal processing protease
MTTKKYYLPIIVAQSILLIICIVALLLTNIPTYNFFNKNKDNSKISQNFTELQLIDTIEKNYLRNLPSETKLQEFKNKGLINSLDDPYSEYITKEEQVKFESNLNQKYFGVGIKIDKVQDSIIVVDVLNGPAKEKGVQKGDIIIKINEEVVTQSTGISQIINKIRGPEKTIVKLQLIRVGQAIDVDLERREIKGDLISLKVDNDLAIIKISSFGEDLDTKMNEIAKQIKSNPTIKRIAIDVRSDTGGLLNEAIDVISYFVQPNSIVVKEKFKQNSQFNVLELKSKSKSNSLINYPTAMITDRFSASASEILAGALKDNRNIPIYGEKTFGKGVVQKIFPLSNGDFVKLTVSEWLTPKDKAIDKIGIEPDFVQEKDKDILDKIKETLK